MSVSRVLRIGTRASLLARWQAEWVAGRLTALGAQVELVPITTSGDAQQVGPIGAIGSVGVFTKEIQRALLADEVDLAVHSLKDLPTDEVAGLTLAAVPERETVADAWIHRTGVAFDEVPLGAIVGTGSLRRQAQLLHRRPDLVLRDIRGNVETRLKKLDSGEFDAIVLAVAGLRRLGLANRITHELPADLMLPAIGQGALGIETRTADDATRSFVSQLEDPASRAAVDAERTLLATLRGGCMAPVAAWGRSEAGELVLSAAVLSRDGHQRLDAVARGSLNDAAQIGQRVANDLVDRGASTLIDQSRH